MHDEDPACRWRRIEPLLDAALDLPEAARGAYLEAAGMDPDDCAEVRRLLDLHERIDHYLDVPAIELAACLLTEEIIDPGDGPPDRVGPYQIVREVGHGGMGTVFLAERNDPHLNQRVALKVVRTSALAPASRDRFFEERQILASLEHPGIARLIDGGLTAGGAPWFAMEYVDGIPIDQYCAAGALDSRARLDLFLQVCDAVQYAHRRLVVHSDLKPANILVTGEGRVKLVDFGVATLLAGGDDLTAGASRRAGRQPLTPGYASPEQIRGGTVSTASDVYALGVLLYRLLADRHPFIEGDVPMDRLVRSILEDEPAPPSSALSGREQRRVRGDLDLIVLTAMRREPERRYATAEQLAADVQRYLGSWPVRARPDSWRYRSRMFARRHPTGLLTGSAFLILLAGYVGTVQAHAARIAEEAARTEQVRDFLVGIFAHANPGVSLGREVTASELVSEGARKVSEELADQPQLQAEMMATLGHIFGTLGRYGEAIEQLEAALEIQRRLFPDPHPTVASTAGRLSEVLHYHGRLPEAEALLREVLRMRSMLHGEADWRVAAVRNDLGDLLHTRGAMEEAEAHLQAALRTMRARRGDDHPDVARARRDLANVLRDEGRHAEAEPLYRAALLSLEAALGDGEPIGALTRNELARLLVETGEFAEAEQLLGINQALYDVLYPEGHPMQGTTMRNLGVLRLRQGRADDAAIALREALAVYEATLPADNPLIPRTLRHLAAAHLAMRDTASAAAAAQEALQRLTAAGLDDHRSARDARHTLHLATGHYQ